MKPKFRKGQIVWVRGKIEYATSDDSDPEVTVSGDAWAGYALKNNTRHNVTRSQLKKWYQYDIEKGCFERLCELLGIE